VIDEPLVFEVQGRTIVVESSPTGWRAHCRANDAGGDAARDIRIPTWVTIEELPRFLAGLFDREDAPGPALVRRVW
jgi:hypothetical protein